MWSKLNGYFMILSIFGKKILATTNLGPLTLSFRVRIRSCDRAVYGWGLSYEVTFIGGIELPLLAVSWCILLYPLQSSSRCISILITQHGLMRIITYRSLVLPYADCLVCYRDWSLSLSSTFYRLRTNTRTKTNSLVKLTRSSWSGSTRHSNDRIRQLSWCVFTWVASTKG